jgi:catechol 2,3-dioxygenase-like lactoylglutathione lyase family enzyme
MLDHVSITVSDLHRAQRFYDAVMAALGILKVGSSQDWIGYGERCDATHPERTYLSIRLGSAPNLLQVATGASRRPVGRRWMRSGGSDWRLVGRMMDLQGSGGPTILPIMPRSLPTQTAIVLRPSATGQASRATFETGS